MNTLYKFKEIIFNPIYYCTLELIHLSIENIKPISNAVIIGISSFALAASLGYYQLATWCLKWIGLGVMSSVGFGFGAHTFVLFLAPHIAAVTLASDSCKSLNFPEPPYPDTIICPDHITNDQVTFFNILQKVALESFMWGLGTAIGELPPYLAARVKGQAISRSDSGDNLGLVSQAAGWELWMIRIINKIGFIGILLCAAIPNPLFDAAGVASGIAQVPFLSFFGATFIGKAIIKVLIQTSFVILIFHSKNLDSLVINFDESLNQFSFTRDLSLYKFLDGQRKNFTGRGANQPEETSKIKFIASSITFIFMFLFLISLIHALSEQYKERKSKSIRRTE